MTLSRYIHVCGLGPSKHLCEDAAEHTALETNWSDAMIRSGMARHIQMIDTLWLIPT